MLSCSICTKDLRDRKALARHMLRHGEKQFICDICSKSFYRKNELKENMYTHNVAMDQNLHVCPTCGHSFKTAGKMRDHRRATHSQSLSSGQVSSIIVQTKSNLNRHMKLHAGYFIKCDKCNKVLKRTKDHPTECNIPKDQRERKFECIICRRKFLNKRYLKEHLKYKHGPKQYKCQKCEKRILTQEGF